MQNQCTDNNSIPNWAKWSLAGAIIEESNYFVDLYEQGDPLFCLEENFLFNEIKIKFNPQEFFHVYKKGLTNQAIAIKK
jgi:hypothetical protein